VAYLDYSRGPEKCGYSHPWRTLPGTASWVRSNLYRSFARQVKSRISNFDQPRGAPGTVLLGSVHENVLEVLRRSHLIERATIPYRKFVFYNTFPTSDIALPSQDFTWGSVRPEDISLVLSRTQIPRKE
jgi:hypothetical protein